MFDRKKNSLKSKKKNKQRTINTIKKTNKPTSTNQVAGGIFGTSYDGKITDRLIKLNVISKDQSKIILAFSRNDKNITKKDKIKSFVDKTLEIILENLYNICIKTKNYTTIKSNQNLLGILNNQLGQPVSYPVLYEKLGQIHKLYGQLTDADKKVLISALSKIKLDNNNITGQYILIILYNLYEKWIKTNTLQELKEPKFVNLYENWFNKEGRNWMEPSVLETFLLQI